MVRATRARGLDAQIMDGQNLTFDHEFDAVFSNAALHWMRRADDVISGVRRALRPRGRFVAEMGGAGNIAKLLAAMVRALAQRGIDGSKLEFRYYPGVDEYREKLERHGFSVSYIELIPRPTPLPGPLGDWFDNFGDVFLNTVPASERDALKREIEQEAAADLKARDGTWIADYVRLRFHAHLD
jgi:SAM-dependent methyltransferase